MNQIFWILVVLVAGIVLPIQAGMNTRLGKEIQSPVWASLISFMVGAFALMVYTLFTKNNLNLSSAKSIPLYLWFSGVLGAFYVTTVIFAIPRLGSSLTFGLIVGGQLLISLLLDHFKILVPEQHPINYYRFAGILLIVLGVVLIRNH